MEDFEKSANGHAHLHELLVSFHEPKYSPGHRVPPSDIDSSSPGVSGHTRSCVQKQEHGARSNLARAPRQLSTDICSKRRPFRRPGADLCTAGAGSARKSPEAGTCETKSFCSVSLHTSRAREAHHVRISCVEDAREDSCRTLITEKLGHGCAR